MSTMSHNGLINYLDDLIYVGLPSQIDKAYTDLIRLLESLGLDISVKKLVPPSTSVTCLGILVDSVDRTISIPPEKMKDILKMCKEWTFKSTVSKSAFQSLLGTLLYICKCVRPARFFLNRMLELLRNNHDKSKISLDKFFFRDLNWFLVFLKNFNGVTYYDIKTNPTQVHLDASLTALGGSFNDMVYTLPLHPIIRHLHITQLEMLNIVVALKIWANVWKDQRITLLCDNLAVVEVLNNGKTRDPYLATCARNVWLLMSTFNIHLNICHIPGKKNNIADLLSRWDQTAEPHTKLKNWLPNYKWVHTHPDLTLLNTHI